MDRQQRLNRDSSVRASSGASWISAARPSDRAAIRLAIRVAVRAARGVAAIASSALPLATALPVPIAPMAATAGLGAALPAGMLGLGSLGLGSLGAGMIVAQAEAQAPPSPVAGPISVRRLDRLARAFLAPTDA